VRCTPASFWLFGEGGEPWIADVAGVLLLPLLPPNHLSTCSQRFDQDDECVGSSAAIDGDLLPVESVATREGDVGGSSGSTTPARLGDSSGMVPAFFAASRRMFIDESCRDKGKETCTRWHIRTPLVLPIGMRLLSGARALCRAHIAPQASRRSSSRPATAPRTACFHSRSFAAAAASHTMDETEKYLFDLHGYLIVPQARARSRCPLAAGAIPQAASLPSTHSARRPRNRCSLRRRLLPSMPPSTPTRAASR